MGEIAERDDAERLLTGLENGGLAGADAVVLAERLDAVLVYVIVTYLRKVYPASDPAATSVLERVVRLTSSGSATIRKHREGAQDPVSRWFESEHAYADFKCRGPELVGLIVDKLYS